MRAVVLWLVLCLAASGEVITCRVQNEGARLRVGGPVVAELELQNSGSRVAQGVLEAVLIWRGHRLAKYVTGELVLTTGSRRIGLTLPPPPVIEVGDGLALELAFVQNRRTIDCGTHALGNYGFQTDFSYAFVRTEARVTADQVRWEQSINPGQMRPALEREVWFNAYAQSLPIERAPANPYGWFNYDLVVLDAPAFAALSTTQLDGLLRWVQGGGSAIATVDETTIRERQMEFLRRASELSAIAPPVDALGKFGLPQPLRMQCGLGRLLLLPTPNYATFDPKSSGWRGHVAWAWRVRDEHFPSIVRTGVWELNRAGSLLDLKTGDALFHYLQSIALQSPKVIGQRKALPWGTVAILLIALLVAAGPGEWWILGWLRRRRWTWITFPVACALCTWAAYRLAQDHLGRKDWDAEVRITDVGPSNRVLRETTLKAHMPAEDSEWRTELEEGLALPVTDEVNMAGVERAVETPSQVLLEGQAGRRFVLRQNVRQWTKNYRQIIRLPEREEARLVDWVGVLKDLRANKSVRAGNPEGFHLYLGAAPVPYRRELDRDPPIPEYCFERLASSFSPVPAIVTHRGPVLSGSENLNASGSSDFIVVGIRRSGLNLEIIRRHVNTSELEPGR